ncbi:hypothetical protein ACWDNI_29780 [Nocardia niigatensis]
MKRGEVWQHSPYCSAAAPRRLEVTCCRRIGSAVISSPYRWLHVVPLVQADPGHVLATYTNSGWADARELHRVCRPRLTDYIGELGAEEMEALDIRLRSTLSL